jgi:hypothetical protein
MANLGSDRRILAPVSEPIILTALVRSAMVASGPAGPNSSAINERLCIPALLCNGPQLYPSALLSFLRVYIRILFVLDGHLSAPSPLLQERIQIALPPSFPCRLLGSCNPPACRLSRKDLRALSLIVLWRCTP